MSNASRHRGESADTPASDAGDLPLAKSAGWILTSAKPLIAERIDHGRDALLAVAPLPALPSYGFPLDLTASFRPLDPKYSFDLELTLQHDGSDWPRVMKQTQTPRPDWVRNAGNLDGPPIAWRPAPPGRDLPAPVQRHLLPFLIACFTVPLEKPLHSEIAKHQAAVREQLRAFRRRTQLSDARLAEILWEYLDAVADQTLHERQRHQYVADRLGYERPDSTVRDAIRLLKTSGRIKQPKHQLPIATSRIRYRIKPGTNTDIVSIGANPLIVIEAGNDYETTDWEQIRIIARKPELEIEILETNRLLHL
jgi:hypothetical protein